MDRGSSVHHPQCMTICSFFILFIFWHIVVHTFCRASGRGLLGCYSPSCFGQGLCCFVTGLQLSSRTLLVSPFVGAPWGLLAKSFKKQIKNEKISISYKAIYKSLKNIEVFMKLALGSLGEARGVGGSPAFEMEVATQEQHQIKAYIASWLAQG